MHGAAASNTAFLAVVKKVRRLLVQGPSSLNGIRSLSRSLGIADDCGGDSVSRAVLASALAENGAAVTEKELDSIVAQLDRSGSGQIDPADLLAALRRDMAPLRRVWLHRVWGAFQKDRTSGSVSVETLQRAYHPDQHPDVLAGQRTANDVGEEFAATFNAITNPDGFITPQEFEQYYSGVSATCADDASFVALLQGVWAFPGARQQLGELAVSTGFSVHQSVAEKKAITAARNHHAELLRVVTEEHRAAVGQSAMASRLLSRSLRSADTSGTSFLSTDAFAQALRDHRLYFTDPAVMSALDTSGDGTVDYLYYLELLLPVLAPARYMMVSRLWQRAFPRKNAQSCVDAKEFVRGFSASSGEERDAFLSSWDVRCAVGGCVSQAELTEWYIPQSCMVELDKEFDALLVRHWPAYAAVVGSDA